VGTLLSPNHPLWTVKPFAKRRRRVWRHRRPAQEDLRQARRCRRVDGMGGNPKGGIGVGVYDRRPPVNCMSQASGVS
jgi:hypothetical protein